MRTRFVQIGIGTIGLFVLMVCLPGRLGVGSGSALASMFQANRLTDRG